MVGLSETFKVVGITLFGPPPMRKMAELHFQPRFEKAFATVGRLGALQLPLPVKARLWKTCVLPQALYGAEFHQPPPALVKKLGVLGRHLFASAGTFHVASWAAPELLMGRPLGSFALEDPNLEIRRRQVRWANTVANSPGREAELHRFLATLHGNWVWKQPSFELLQALETLKWRQLITTEYPDLLRLWPELPPSLHREMEFVLSPSEEPLMEGAFFTDGSVTRKRWGGLCGLGWGAKDGCDKKNPFPSKHHPV